MDKLEQFSTNIIELCKVADKSVIDWIWWRVAAANLWIVNHPNTIKLALSIMVIALFFACWLAGETYVAKEG